MILKRDYYEVLGVNKNADAATIKKAYRKLAKIIRTVMREMLRQQSILRK